MKTLEAFLREKRVIICIGPGGTGKTTISAALALEGALSGKKTLALTVDPAMRLATSLDISKQRNTQVDKKRFEKAGLICEGELHVIMLDVRKTFDELIEKVAQSQSAKGKILSNKYYQSIADSLAGSHEYMAMEMLLSVHEKGEYELIVVDTPPSQHISDFLSAPRRLINILEAVPLKWVFRSYSLMDRLSFGFTKLWASLALRILERIVGVDVLHDVWEFFSDFEGINEPLKKRAEKTYEPLKSDKSGFLIITSPRKPALHDSLYLYKNLKGDGFEVGGIIANRFYSEDDFADLESEIKYLLGENIKLAERLTQNYKNYKSVVDSDRLGLEELRKDLKDRVPIISIPYLDSEVCDLEGLFKLRGYLFRISER